MKLYPKIDLHVDGFYWTTTQRYPTLSKALQALKSQAPAYIQSGQPSRFLVASFQDSAGSRRIKIYENRKKKTRKKVIRRKRRSMREKRVMRIKRGLMKRARKLRLGAKRTGAYVYGTLRRIVGNPGDRGLSPGLRRLEDTFEEYGITNPYLQRKMISRLVMKMPKKKRNKILNSPYGIDTLEKALEGYLKGLKIRAYDETMKSMGYKRVRRNPAYTDRPHYGFAKMDIKLLGTGLKIDKGEEVYMTPATNIPGGGFFARPAILKGIWKQVSEDDSILIRPGEFDDYITYVKPRGEYKPTPQVKPDWKYGIYTGRGIARNPISYHVGGLSSLGAMGEQRRKLKIGKQEQALLNFAKKYPGWHGFNPRKHTADVVRRLAKKGLIELSNISNQFRELKGNPPMYAHRMMSHRTHGLSLKQMMKLYRLVSSGNPKAVMFARRTLGIPMSESLSQVKAVVYHHVLDLKGKI